MLVRSSHAGASFGLTTIGVRWWISPGAPIACLVTMTSRSGVRSSGFRLHSAASPATPVPASHDVRPARRAGPGRPFDPGIDGRDAASHGGRVAECAFPHRGFRAGVAQQLACWEPVGLESPRERRGLGPVRAGDDREGLVARPVLAGLEQVSTVEPRSEDSGHRRRRRRLEHSSANAASSWFRLRLRVVYSGLSQPPGRVVVSRRRHALALAPCAWLRARVWCTVPHRAGRGWGGALRCRAGGACDTAMRSPGSRPRPRPWRSSARLTFIRWATGPTMRIGSSCSHRMRTRIIPVPTNTRGRCCVRAHRSGAGVGNDQALAGATLDSQQPHPCLQRNMRRCAAVFC